MLSKKILSSLCIIVISLFFNLYAQDSCHYYAAQGLKEYKKSHFKAAILAFKKGTKNCDSKVVAKCYNDIANAYSYLNLPDSAAYYYFKALSVWENIKDSSNIAKCFKNIGTVYQEIGDTAKSMYYCNKAERIASAINDTDVMADCFNNKGILYDQAGLFMKSFEYYQKAIKLYLTLNKTDRLIATYNNLARIT